MIKSSRGDLNEMFFKKIKVTKELHVSHQVPPQHMLLHDLAGSFQEILSHLFDVPPPKAPVSLQRCLTHLFPSPALSPAATPIQVQVDR